MKEISFIRRSGVVSKINNGFIGRKWSKDDITFSRHVTENNRVNINKDNLNFYITVTNSSIIIPPKEKGRFYIYIARQWICHDPTQTLVYFVTDGLTNRIIKKGRLSLCYWTDGRYFCAEDPQAIMLDDSRIGIVTSQWDFYKNRVYIGWNVINIEDLLYNKKELIVNAPSIIEHPNPKSWEKNWSFVPYISCKSDLHFIYTHSPTVVIRFPAKDWIPIVRKGQVVVRAENRILRHIGNDHIHGSTPTMMYKIDKNENRGYYLYTLAHDRRYSNKGKRYYVNWLIVYKNLLSSNSEIYMSREPFVYSNPEHNNSVVFPRTFHLLNNDGTESIICGGIHDTYIFTSILKHKDNIIIPNNTVGSNDSFLKYVDTIGEL